MINQVSGEILEFDGQIILHINSIKKIDKFAHKFRTLDKRSILKDLSHDSDKLVYVSFLIRKHLKMLRDLK